VAVYKQSYEHPEAGRESTLCREHIQTRRLAITSPPRSGSTPRALVPRSIVCCDATARSDRAAHDVSRLLNDTRQLTIDQRQFPDWWAEAYLPEKLQYRLFDPFKFFGAGSINSKWCAPSRVIKFGVIALDFALRA